MECGDCISVCPQDAIINSNLFSEKMKEDDISLGPEQLLNFMKSRRSIRSYNLTNLSEYEKEYLAKMASLTPRGGHTKSIRNTSIVIIENEELIKNITEYTYEYMYILKKRLSSVWVNIAKAFNSSFRNGLDNTIERIDLILKAKGDNINMLTYDAPNLVILHNEKSSPISKDNLNIMEYQLMLGAEALNLGTCFLGWVSFAMQSFRAKKSYKLKEIYKTLEIPSDRQISGVFSIGQKKGRYRKIKGRGETAILTK